ncbi:SNF2 family N-terminal domain-containing protein [Nemania sp. FL0031]|nr:SNF2 family N-terminal domain-containing protein [Nemania sp. FL0031]
MNIPCSSPFFTQPTQVVKRGTQPTQIVGRTTQPTQPTQLVGRATQPTQILDRTTQPTQITGRTTLRPPSSPLAPSSPSMAIEVPASSPFQPKTQPKASPFIEKKKGVASRIGSLMAPAGTSFRPPAGRTINPARPTPKFKAYLNISDDELSEDYKHHDSSGDEAPMRGDIKPSSFIKNDIPPLETTETRPAWTAGYDIELKDIHDLRLRHLTRKVHKIVSKAKKNDVTIKACRDALMKGVGWDITKAVDLLLGNSNNASNNSSSKPPTKTKQLTLTKSFSGSFNSASPTKSSFSQQDCSLTSNSTTTSSNPTSYSSAASSFTKNNQPPPRRRLIQGRKKKSPTPPPAEVEPEPEPADDSSAFDQEEDSVQISTVQLPHHGHSLAQITGFSAADSKVIISSRPFATVLDVEKVSKKDSKSKSKAKRLTSWFAAFHAASEVIKLCEDRGKRLQEAMSNWPMDKNGNPKKGTALPVSEKPDLMAEDITLKSYQLLGLNWMNLLHSERFSGILADDMGLGKTCQRSGDTRPWPCLVVFERFAPELSVCPYLGKDRRNMDPEEARDNHVILTSYSQVEKAKEDLRWLQDLDPYAAIFDEGHKLKNRKNLIYKQMMRVPTQWRLIMSGTPVQNNLKELLTLLHFVEPDLFGDQIFDQLDTIFEAKVPNKEIHNFAALAKERVSNARAIMAPFILQRRKEEVLDLAKKTEHNAIYEEVKGRYLVPKKQRGSSTIKDSHSWMQLRKAAIHHQLFRVHFTDEIVKKMVDILWKKCSEEELYIQSKADRHKALLLENYMEKSDFQLHLECKHFKKYIGHFDIPHRSWEEGPKVQKLLELVRGYMKNGDRVLVFSRFDLVIDILRETLAFADIPYCELTGSTDISERFPEIERFNENPDIPVFLLTTGAGGTGLNLTAANKIIIFDQSDNPQDDVQASNRAHRIGQTRDVEVIRLITKDSVEGLIFNSCVKKLMLARIVEGNVPVDEDAESESVEQQCRRLMLLEDEAAVQASQVT